MAVGTSDGEYYPSHLEGVLASLDTSGSTKEPLAPRNAPIDELRNSNEDPASRPVPTDVRSDVKVASTDTTGKNSVEQGRIDLGKEFDKKRNDNEGDWYNPKGLKLIPGQNDQSINDQYPGSIDDPRKWMLRVQADPQSRDTPGSDMEYKKQTPPTYSGEITDSWNAIAPFRGKMVDPWTLSPNDMRDYLQEQKKQQEENFPFREKLPDVPVRPGDSPPPPAKNPRRPMTENSPSVIQVADRDIRTLFPHMSEEEMKAWEQSPPRDLQYKYKGKSGILDIPGTLDSKGHEDGVFVDQLHPDLLKLPQDEYDIRFVPGHEIFHIQKKTKPPLVGEADLPANAQPAQFLYSNANAADKEMNLTPEEKNLYDTHLRNLIGKGGVDNEDGSRSTLKADIVGLGDKQYILPTVKDGKFMNIDETVANAKKIGLDKFPSYDTEEEAKARYDQMHTHMEKDTKNYQEAQTVYKGIVNLLTDFMKTPGQEMQNWSGKELLGYMLSTGLSVLGPGLKAPTPAAIPRSALPKVDAQLLGKDMGVSNSEPRSFLPANDNVKLSLKEQLDNAGIKSMSTAEYKQYLADRKRNPSQSDKELTAMNLARMSADEFKDYMASRDAAFSKELDKLSGRSAYERALANQKAGRMNPTGDTADEFIKSLRNGKKPNLRLVEPEKNPTQEP